MNSQSKNIVIIGDPISHSLSPAMQNAAFEKLKLPYFYSAKKLSNNELPKFFKELSKHRIAGLNVTVPHKQAVLKYLDKISEEAKLIGAVNTIEVTSQGLKGFNTDGEGYLRSLIEETSLDPKNKNIFILGAGGASRALVAILCMKKVKSIVIANRTFDKAKDLTKEFQKKFPATQIQPLLFETKNLEFDFPQTDLLINTTSLGLEGKDFPDIPLQKLPKHAVVSDIVYRPLITHFLSRAQKLKFKIHPGWGMLLYQGVLAFEIWTHQKAPIETMKAALKRELEKVSREA